MLFRLTALEHSRSYIKARIVAEQLLNSGGTRSGAGMKAQTSASMIIPTPVWSGYNLFSCPLCVEEEGLIDSVITKIKQCLLEFMSFMLYYLSTRESLSEWCAKVQPVTQAFWSKRVNQSHPLNLNLLGGSCFWCSSYLLSPAWIHYI